MSEHPAVKTAEQIQAEVKQAKAEAKTVKQLQTDRRMSLAMRTCILASLAGGALCVWMLLIKLALSLL